MDRVWIGRSPATRTVGDVTTISTAPAPLEVEPDDAVRSLVAPLPADDVEIDLRDHGRPRVVAVPRPRRRPVRTALRAVRRSLPVAGWLVVFGIVALLFLPTLLGFSRYAIVGGSMSPTFERGSAVFSQPQPVDALRVGDIITYVPPPAVGIDHLVTHRIVEITESDAGEPMFRTKGDANATADPWTFSLDAAEQNVVVFSIPHLGTVLTELSDPAVRRIVVGIPAGLIGLGAVLELVGVAPMGELLRRRRRTAALS